MSSPLVALLRFHLASVIPASLRALAPVAAAGTVAIMLQPTPTAAVTAIVVAVVGVIDHPVVNLAVVAGALALSRAVGARVMTRRDDWLGHLPATSRDRRVAGALACAVGPAPAVAAIVVFAALHAAAGIEIRPVRLAALAALCLPAGAFGVLSRRPLISMVAGGAAWFTVEGGWTGVAGGPLVALGMVILAHSDIPRRRLWALPLPPTLAVALRAVGARPVASAAVGAVIASCARVFATSNDLPAWQVDRATVLATLIGVLAAAVSTAEMLARRRPPWPWARSLPWSARRRVLEDAAMLAVVASPAVLATVVWRPAVVLAVVLAAPALVLAAAAGIRRQPGATFGASVDVLLVGGVASCWLAIVPALAAAGPVGAWLALRWAIARERRLSGVVLDPQLAFEAEEASR